jgi:CIC family chloride channel protein
MPVQPNVSASSVSASPKANVRLAVMTVGEAGSVNLIVTYPEEPPQASLTQMLRHDIGRLPVVDPLAPTQVLGYLGRAAILTAQMRRHHEETIRQKG